MVAPNRSARILRGRGATMIYMLAGLPVFAGFCSLAVDYGRAQLAKTGLRRAADATAHDYMVLYGMSGRSYANANGPASYSQAKNPVDSLSSVPPTFVVTWGYWNETTRTFNTSNNGGNVAVKVTASCTKANGNGVPLLFGSLLGAQSIDIHAGAIAEYIPQVTVNINVDATSDPYFAGMPTGTVSTYGDDALNNGANEATALNVAPGDTLTFTPFTGTTSVLPGYMPYFGAAGAVGAPNGSATHHGENWDGGGSVNGYSENGIADAIMPESALMGVFLTDAQPDSTAAPSTVVDWTDTTLKNQVTYSSLQNKAPFYIGTGKTSSGTQKEFIVPAGATRFFIGTWDGLQYNSNAGILSGSITRSARVALVN